MELKIKKLHPDAKLPTYGTEGAACFDLYADFGATRLILRPGECCAFPTGLIAEIPPGWVMKVYSRSGHGFMHGVRLVNGTGIIDSDYRGEVMVDLRNDGSADFTVHSGDRIAQAMLVPVERVSFVEVDELTDTARGSGGFGSTGA